MLPPPAELAFQLRSGEEFPLPERIVRVLPGEGRERRGLPGEEGGIECGQLPDQHPRRPAVRDDVVQIEQRHVFGRRGRLGRNTRCKPHQEDSEQRTRAEVERTPRLGAGERLGGRPPQRLWKGREVDLRQDDPALGRDHLDRPISSAGEGRAEHFVAPHDLVQRRAEHGRTQRAAQADEGGHVVDRAPRFELIEKPEPLLSEGKRRLRPPPGTWHRAPRRGARGRAPRHPRHSRHHRRQPPHRRLGEERPERHLHPERRAEARHQPGGEERVTPESEEVVERPHPLPAQHLAPDFRHFLLGGRPRRHVHGFFRRQFLRHLGSDLGERPPVDLAVGGQRQPFEDDERPRHHVRRQARPQSCPQLRPGDRHAGRPLDIRHEPAVAGPVRAHEDRRPAHSRAGRERRLDLPQLDPEAAHLDLLVDPAQEVDLPPRQGTRQVPRPVEARSGLRRERIGDELLRRELRPPQVPRPHSLPADRELPGHPERQRREMAIQGQQAKAGESPADRGRSAVFRGAQPTEGHHVGALGRTVGVDHLGVTPDGLAPGGEPSRGDRLPTQEHAAERREPFEPALLQEGVEGARGAVEPGDLVPLEGGDDLAGIVGRRVGEDQETSREKRGEEVLLGEIEAGRGHDQEAILG